MAAEWYLVQNNQRRGPYRLEDLKAAVAKKSIPESVLVMRKTDAAAIPLRDVLAQASGNPAQARPISAAASAPNEPFEPADLEQFGRQLNSLLDGRRRTMMAMNQSWRELQEAIRLAIRLETAPAAGVKVAAGQDLPTAIAAQIRRTHECAERLQRTAQEISQAKDRVAQEEQRATTVAWYAGLAGAMGGSFLICAFISWLMLGTCFGILFTIACVWGTRYLATATKSLWIPPLTRALVSRSLLNLQVDAYQRQVDTLREKKNADATELAQAAGGCMALQSEVLLQGVQTLNQGRSSVDALCERPPVHVAGRWDDGRWHRWQPDVRSLFVNQLRVGEYREDIFTELKSQFDAALLEFVVKHSLPATYPSFVPFIGEDKTIVIACDDSTLDDGLAVLHSLLVRIACLFPVKSQFTLLDPATHGRAFPMLQQMRQRRAVKDDMYTTLRDIEQSMTHVYQEVLGFEKRLDLLPDERRNSELFEFIFVANFPDGFDRRSVEKLLQIAKNGPPAGRYFFVHFNKNRETEHQPILSQLTNAHVFEPTKSFDHFRWLLPDAAPADDFQRDVLTRIRSTKQADTNLGAGIVALQSGERMWGADATETIRSPVADGGSKSIDIAFGKDCPHGLLVGMTGSGKSTLYHTLIYGLCQRYSPEDLQLYLIDGKQGVEFQHFLFEQRLDPRTPERAARFQRFASLGTEVVLPHIAVVSLHTTPDLSCSILQHLIDEQVRRNALFTKVGVQSFEDYAKRGHPEGRLPRLLLIVDEYQEFFEDEAVAAEASALLGKLAQQSRSAGIHMLLGSQKVGAAGMTQQDRIFGNMQLRVGLMMPAAELLAMPHFGTEGKQMLRACDERGKVVINDRGGQDGRNQFGKVAYLDNAIRDEWIVKQLELMASDDFQRKARHRPKVIHGWHQPRFLDNPCVSRYLAMIAKAGRHPTAPELETFARQDPANVDTPGFGIPTWLAAECPVALWIGQLLRVHGHALLTLRRDVGQNAALLGSSPQTRLGMLTALLASAPLHYPRQRIALRIVDGSLRGSPSQGKLEAVHQQLLSPLGYDSVFHDTPEGADAVMVELLAELTRRSAGQSDAPSVLIVFNELERFRNTHRPQGYGAEASPFSRGLKKLLSDGPPLGMHVVLSTSTQISLSQLIDDRSDLQRVNHRVALQMSADDSQIFLGTRHASTLQKDGDQPVFGLSVNLAQGKTGQRFKPFDVDHVLEAIPSLVSQLQRAVS